MMCEACVSVVVYIVTGSSRTIFYGAGDRLVRKMSSYVEWYEYVELYYRNMRALIIDLIIRSNMNLI